MHANSLSLFEKKVIHYAHFLLYKSQNVIIDKTH